MLKISPHTRAGEGGADTALNVTARALWKDQSPEIQSALQDVVRLQSHKNDLEVAHKLLATLKNNPDFKDEISRVGYEPLLWLMHAALSDETWGENPNIPGRWRSLMTRMVRVEMSIALEIKPVLLGSSTHFWSP